ncbi:hypothetical protein GCM10009737_26230 [Nocardioides lentus]|uniref:Uncharacterized protein n=1 Tax=Nocardioides lentus TaxID=338077 RepID=A0ABP5AV16_9ACTN
MAEPLLWWHHHHLAAPATDGRHRFTVQRHPWGVTVWEGPVRGAPWIPFHVVDVVVTDPDAPVELAAEVARERLPAPGWDRRLVRALPGELSPRTPRHAVVAALVVLLVVLLPLGAVVTGVAAVLAVLGVVVGDLLAGDRGARRARRTGHVAASVPLSGRVQLADALCQRALAHGMPHAGHVRRAVRTALWTCRAPDSRSSGRLNRWLGDVDRADQLATGVAMYDRSMTGAASTDGLGPSTVVARAAALAPELVAACAGPDEAHRREALAQLRDLRDACRDARAAREALETTVGRAAPPELRAVGPDPATGVAAEVAADARRERVGDLLRELRAEAGILREVDAELRGRDEPRSFGA